MNVTKYQSLGWLCLFLVSTIAVGQNKKWTLEECVWHALEHNISIQQSELDLKATDIDKLEAIGGFLPSLNANANYGINTGANINPATNQFENETFKSASASVNTGVNLFSGLANWKNLQRAKLNKVANQYRLDKMKDDTALFVANAFLQILFVKEQLKILTGQFNITEENIERTQELINAGQLPAGDLYELLATKATQEQQIINAENELLIAKIGLAQTLLIKDYVNFDIVDEDYNIPMSEVMNSNPQQIADRAKEVVNDVKVAEANRDLAVKDTELARTAYAPRISAFFGYNTRWAESIPLPFEQQIYLFDGTSIGFQLSVPFLNGFSTRGRVQRAKVNEERSNLLLEQATLDLERNVYQAYNDMINAQKSYDATQKTAEARKLAYDFAKERYDIGMTNAFEMNQSQILYVNAASDVVRAKYDFIFRVKVLEFYFGIPIIQKP